MTRAAQPYELEALPPEPAQDWARVATVSSRASVDDELQWAAAGSQPGTAWRATHLGRSVLLAVTSRDGAPIDPPPLPDRRPTSAGRTWLEAWYGPSAQCLWMLDDCRGGVPRRMLVSAACAFARPALRHVPAGVAAPREALDATEAWLSNEIDRADLLGPLRAAVSVIPQSTWETRSAFYEAARSAASACGAAYNDDPHYDAHAAALASILAEMVGVPGRAESEELYDRLQREGAAVVRAHVPMGLVLLAASEAASVRANLLALIPSARNPGGDGVPPVSVRRALRAGLELHRRGFGGDGLVDDTVAWARRLERGEPITPEKARAMRAWFARHGASPAESAARAAGARAGARRTARQGAGPRGVAPVGRRRRGRLVEAAGRWRVGLRRRASVIGRVVG